VPFCPTIRHYQLLLPGLLGHHGRVMDPDVLAHYELGLEDTRLRVSGRPRLEFVRTLELLARFLPSAPARVLDVGGGTGAYAVPLAKQGYQVHVVEPVQVHVDAVRGAAVQLGLSGLTASVGDARDLAAYHGRFDATLLLGPLYHLPDQADRAQAFGEAVLATAVGGSVTAVGISRFATLLDGLAQRWLSDPTFREIVERGLAGGLHRNPDVAGRPEWFTTAYLHHPQELRQEAVDAGLVDVTVLAVEGPAWMVEDAEDLEQQLFAARQTESEPTLMGATSHILVSGKVEG